MTTTATDRKRCANPACANTVPLSWTYCKDRNCQGTRRLSPNFSELMRVRFDAQKRKEQSRNGSTTHRQAIRRWKLANPERIADYRLRAQLHRTRLRRERLKYEDQAAIRNAIWRVNALAKAEAEANEELRELIAEQRRDTDRVRRGKGDPWRMLSLDAALYTDGEMTLAESTWRGNDYWADPTGEAAIERVEDEPW